MRYHTLFCLLLVAGVSAGEVAMLMVEKEVGDVCFWWAIEVYPSIPAKI